MEDKKESQKQQVIEHWTIPTFFSSHGRKTLWFKISAIIQDIEICVTRQR
jgi:hypothetical protein